jgi:hypothetical protein
MADNALLGAKRTLKPRQVWAIRFWLDRGDGEVTRLCDLAIDGKLQRYRQNSDRRSRQ